MTNKNENTGLDLYEATEINLEQAKSIAELMKKDCYTKGWDTAKCIEIGELRTLILASMDFIKPFTQDQINIVNYYKDRKEIKEEALNLHEVKKLLRLN